MQLGVGCQLCWLPRYGRRLLLRAKNSGNPRLRFWRAPRGSDSSRRHVFPQHHNCWLSISLLRHLLPRHTRINAVKCDPRRRAADTCQVLHDTVRWKEILHYIATSLLNHPGAFGLSLGATLRRPAAFLTSRLVQADSLDRVKISQAHRLFSPNHARSPHVILLSAASASGCVGLKNPNLNPEILQHNSASPRATST